MSLFFSNIKNKIQDIRNVEYKVFDDKLSSIVDDSTQDVMVNLTKLGTNNDDDDVEATCVSGREDEDKINNQLTTQFLAGVNMTA